MSWRTWPSWKPLPWWQSLLAGLICGALAAGARWMIPASAGAEAPFVVYFPFVALAAAVGGFSGGGAALLCASLAALAWRSAPGPDFFGLLAIFWGASALVIALLAGTGRMIAELRRSHEIADRAKDQLQTLANELSHRNRNSLFVVMAIVKQSARAADSAAEAAAIINSRLEALLRGQELLVESGTGTIGLKALLQRILEPFGLERFEIAAAVDVELATDVGVGLGLVFHELATNALKHGAFAHPSGRVQIAWRRRGETVKLDWRERGGAPVIEPSRRGFGSRLFEVALVPQGGKADCRFEPEGLTCELTIPAPANPPWFLSPVPEGANLAQGALGESSPA